MGKEDVYESTVSEAVTADAKQDEDNITESGIEAGSSVRAGVESAAFDPRAYLVQFYTGGVDPGNRALLRFYTRIYADLAGGSLLEFSGGPTIYSLITAARTASWIHFCDYTPQSLKEVQMWLEADAAAFDWSDFVRYALSCERGCSAESITKEEIKAREQLIRQRIRTLSRCDAFADDPLCGSSRGPYQVVANTFCLDSITNGKREWLRLNRKLASLVAPGGWFVTVYLLNASHWTIQGASHLAVPLTPEDVASMYDALGFRITHSDVISDLEGKIGYDGFIMTCGIKKT